MAHKMFDVTPMLYVTSAAGKTMRMACETRPGGLAEWVARLERDGWDLDCYSGYDLGKNSMPSAVLTTDRGVCVLYRTVSLVKR
jgi:hypothetical protein